ncbi:DMT family transporter [Sneathiella aquimaris]|uniref:DMT family transporter n=1 Tax=Sneathiella aquimaris TaxID=2599305 RepID=UPI00146A05E1|nr:DMT family transporter [Sneathiella aquimaris]
MSRNTLASISYMIIACSFFALASVIAKLLGNDLLGPPLSAFQIAAGRFCFAFLALLPVLAIRRPTYRNVPVKLHIGRTIFGWLGVVCLFAAASGMALADATSISFLSPVITMVLAAMILKEKVVSAQWYLVALSFLGMLFITRPGMDSFQPLAIIAIASAIFMGTEAIFIKRLSDTESPLRILSINNGIGAVIALCLVSFFWVQPTPLQWLFLALIGAIMVSGQSLFIQAMKRGDASFLAPFVYFTPLFAAIIDYLIFSEIVGFLSFIGITAILISAALQSRVKKA